MTKENNEEGFIIDQPKKVYKQEESKQETKTFVEVFEEKKVVNTKEERNNYEK